MSYSFIKPQKKDIFSLFSKIWIVFILFTFTLLFLLNLFIWIKTSMFESSQKSRSEARVEYLSQIDDLDLRNDSIEREKILAHNIYTSNLVLRDSIRNLFELVPDQITLSRVVMNSDSLYIYGKTPSREMYNFLLASPLRSIFHDSTNVFYLDEDGWYRFVSTNKIIDKEGFNE